MGESAGCALPASLKYHRPLDRIDWPEDSPAACQSEMPRGADAGMIILIVATIALFGGEGLSGWVSRGDTDWSVEDGVLIGSGAGQGFFLTNRDYGDFRLRLEFWIDVTTNSGVFIRCRDRNRIHPETCYELNIWDEHPRQAARTGAIVLKAMPPLAILIPEKIEEVRKLDGGKGSTVLAAEKKAIQVSFAVEQWNRSKPQLDKPPAADQSDLWALCKTLPNGWPGRKMNKKGMRFTVLLPVAEGALEKHKWNTEAAK